jgi:DNA-binding transcriptional LysR family regulator
MTAATSSHQIRRLERELGTPLFERTSRRVVPTEAGQVIAGRARTILAELDGARQEVDELSGVLRGHIWIGALLPAGDIDVPGLLARFSRLPGHRRQPGRGHRCRHVSSRPTNSMPRSVAGRRGSGRVRH